MRPNQRLKHLLAAGILTGLVLATVIAFTWRDTSRADASATKTDATLTMSESESMDTWRAENEQLRQAVETLRARDQAYQTQLEAANRTILQLQNGATQPRHDDDDEHGKHEREDEHGEEKHD